MPWITDEEIKKYNLPKNIKRYFSIELASSREAALQQIARLRSKTKDNKQENKNDIRFTAGVKFDDNKDRMDLIAPEAIFALARVSTNGAIKYEERNWEKGMKWGRVFGACMRHMWSWWGGKEPTSTNFLLGNLDTEWGFSHLWHAIWCIQVLIAYEERRVGTDDRHTRKTV